MYYTISLSHPPPSEQREGNWTAGWYQAGGRVQESLVCLIYDAYYLERQITVMNFRKFESTEEC